MSPLKVIIPLFIVLGILQAAVLSLPFIYWRFACYMGPINKLLFSSFLCVNLSPITLNSPTLQLVLTYSPSRIESQGCL